MHKFAADRRLAYSEAGWYFITPRFKRYPRFDQAGLTIVELLVSLLLISFAIIASSSIITGGVFGLRKTELNYDTQNLIDRNLSTIEDLADRYSCVDVPCTVLSAVPESDGYLEPSNPTEWAAFKDLCQQSFLTDPPSDLISPLASYIEANVPVPSGLYRDITVNGSGSDIGIGRIKHLTVQFRLSSSTGPIVRNSTIIPTVVSYCP